MNFRPLLVPVVCFLTGYGMTRALSRLQRTFTGDGVAGEGISSSRPPQRLPGLMLPPDRRRQVDAEVAAAMALPANPVRDEPLSLRCAELLPTNVGAAYLLGTARWAWDWDNQRAAGMKLARSEPGPGPGVAAAVLARCPDLRSRDMLEGCLAAAAVERAPREKLRWAESTLEGDQRQHALMTGVRALVPGDPDAVLAFTLEPTPSELMMNIVKLALEQKIRNDPEATIAWIDQHIPETRKDSMARPLLQIFASISPDQAKSLLSQIPRPLQPALLAALLLEAFGDTRNTGQKYQLGLELINKLPAEFQPTALRELVAEVAQEDAGQSVPQLLVLTSAEADTAKRRTIIESLMFSAFGSPRPDPQPDREALLENLRTTEDKATAAQTLPYLMGLTEETRAAIADRLR